MVDFHADVAATFQAFVLALQGADLAAFHALCVQDEPPQDDVFLHNAGAVRAAQLTPRLRRVHQRGSVAEVRFDLLRPDGSSAGETAVTLSQEADGWRIRGL